MAPTILIFSIFHAFLSFIFRPIVGVREEGHNRLFWINIVAIYYLHEDFFAIFICGWVEETVEIKGYPYACLVYSKKPNSAIQRFFLNSSSFQIFHAWNILYYFTFINCTAGVAQKLPLLKLLAFLTTYLLLKIENTNTYDVQNIRMRFITLCQNWTKLFNDNQLPRGCLEIDWPEFQKHYFQSKVDIAHNRVRIFFKSQCEFIHIGVKHFFKYLESYPKMV